MVSHILAAGSCNQHSDTFSSFFSFFHLNDDEAAIRRLRLTLSCTVAIALSNCMFLCLFCFSFFIHYFGCLLWFLFSIIPIRCSKGSESNLDKFYTYKEEW